VRRLCSNIQGQRYCCTESTGSCVVTQNYYVHFLFVVKLQPCPAPRTARWPKLTHQHLVQNTKKHPRLGLSSDI
jgi:hypothetical protein